MTKVRITGGEPLTRRDVLEFLRAVPAMHGIRDIGLSTNGTLLAREVRAGTNDGRPLCVKRVFDSVNISLDTLDREFYAAITGRDFFPQAMEGIDAAIDAGFEQIKLNAVLMRGRNEDQLVPLIEFAAERGSASPLHRADAGEHERSPE